MEIKQVLAFNIRKHRKARGLSQEELAHRADIDRTYISALERGRYAASVEIVDRLAKELGVEPSALLARPSPRNEEDGNGNSEG